MPEREDRLIEFFSHEEVWSPSCNVHAIVKAYANNGFHVHVFSRWHTTICWNGSCEGYQEGTEL